MTLPVVFRLEAQADFDEAIAWYEKQRQGLGEDFLSCVEQALDRIAESPLHYEKVHPHVRRAPVHRFPYGVIYQVDTDQILVVAVFHDRRNPSVWKSRT